MKKKYIPLFYLLLVGFMPSSPAQDTIYVNANLTTGNGDGTTWANAFTDLNLALFTAEYGDQVWVASGTYLPGDPSFPNRNFSFQLNNGVRLYGGFAGTETALDQRDWTVNSTILSGDTGVPGDSTDNSYTVAYCTGADSTTVLDGFTITKGNADGALGTNNFLRQKSGGGLYIEGGPGTGLTAPRVRNCTFSDNYAGRFGGGAFVRSRSGAEAVANFTNCLFEENTGWRGGGCDMTGLNSLSPAVFEGCTFRHNNGFLLGGGGVSILGDYGTQDVHFKNCNFLDNIGENEGGGVRFELHLPDIDLAFEGCTFSVSEEAGTKVPEGSCLGGVSLGGDNKVGFHNSHFHIVGFQVAGLIMTTSIDSIELDKCTVMGMNCSSKMNPIRFSFASSVELTNIEVSGFSKLEGNGNLGVIDFGYIPNVHIINSVLTNLMSDFDPVINCKEIDNLHISNSILHKNFSGTNVQGVDFPIVYFDEVDNTPHSLSMSHNMIEQDSCSSPQFTNATNITCGPGMLYGMDPLFADTATGDFHLHPCSPARNAGDNDITNTSGITTDIDGNPRILEGTVDMGPYEMPAFDVLVNATTPANCHGESSGSAVIDVRSGCGPFSFAFGGASTFTDSLPFVLDGLPPGTFNITVKDSEGRTEGIQLIIGEPPLLTATATVKAVDCGEGTLGTATAAIGGGTPSGAGGYGILWSDGSDMATANFPTGSYGLQVTDSLGCTAVDSFLVGAIGQLAVTVDSTAISCHPSNGNSMDGTATATPSGAAPYSWQWQDGQSTETIGMLGGGTYTATVTDALGCKGTATVALSPPDSIGLSIDAPAVVCPGSMDANAVAIANGGTRPYSFQWQGGQTDSLLMGIGAGIYTASLTDGNGCTAQNTLEIAEGTPIELDTLIEHATGPVEMDGAVFISNVQGGTAPYQFFWESGDTTASLENLPPGTYPLTVTDSLGCETIFTFVVDFEVAVLGVPDGWSIQVYPNPVGIGLPVTLQFTNGITPALKIQLLDALGRCITQAYDSVPNNGSIYLTSPSTSGVYWWSIEDKNGHKMFKKLVVH